MADVITVKVNIPDFKRQLQALGARMEKNIARRGIRAAGAVFVAEARRRAPVLREPRKGRVAGALQRAIRSVSRRSQRGELKQSVGVRATRAQSKQRVDPFYWRFLEGGWVPRGPGRRFKGGTRRRKLERERAIAGGERRVAYPFLKPAFDAAGTRALEAFNQAVADGIAKEGRR